MESVLAVAAGGNCSLAVVSSGWFRVWGFGARSQILGLRCLGQVVHAHQSRNGLQACSVADPAKLLESALLPRGSAGEPPEEPVAEIAECVEVEEPEVIEVPEVIEASVEEEIAPTPATSPKQKRGGIKTASMILLEQLESACEQPDEAMSKEVWNATEIHKRARAAGRGYTLFWTEYRQTHSQEDENPGAPPAEIYLRTFHVHLATEIRRYEKDYNRPNALVEGGWEPWASDFNLGMLAIGKTLEFSEKAVSEAAALERLRLSKLPEAKPKARIRRRIKS